MGDKPIRGRNWTYSTYIDCFGTAEDIKKSIGIIESRGVDLSKVKIKSYLVPSECGDLALKLCFTYTADEEKDRFKARLKEFFKEAIEIRKKAKKK